MKRLYLFLTCVLLCLMLTSCGGEQTTVAITIPEGSSVSQIADMLKQSGLIKSTLLFKSKTDDTDGYIKPGEYHIIKGTSTDEIIAILKAGVESVTLTVPEGFSVEMLAQRTEALGICSAKDFLEAANSTDYDFDFLKHIKPDSRVKYKLQGFLYPNTYFVSKNTNARDVVSMLLGEFERQLADNVKADNLYEAVTVASLLEREATVESEKPVIAGVIYNRIKQNMLLQIDAAVVYAVTDGKYDVNAVYYKDLKIDSPYNLYKYKGLPPGPICSPSISSVNAAVNPQRHEYLYYRTNDNAADGTHVFTKTYDEHLNANK